MSERYLEIANFSLYEPEKSDMVKWPPFPVPVLSPGINLPTGLRYTSNRTSEGVGNEQLNACEGYSRDRSLLSKNSLLRLKTKALRNRVWFRVLSRLERGLLD